VRASLARSFLFSFIFLYIHIYIHICIHIYIYMYTHMYLAECAAALSSAYAYTYVPSRYTCIYIYVFTHTYLAECPAALSRAYAHTYVPSRVPSHSLGRQFALSDANLLSRMFTRDVTRPERRPMPWLGSGWESQKFAGVAVLLVLCMFPARALSFPSTDNASHRSPRHLCV